MATSITADDMLAALKKWGITPKFYASDWRTHNRNAVQGWGELYGFVVHNFASDISDSSSLAYLYNGDSARSLPGPLSQFAITDDGQVWIIGWGTANHCKSVDRDLHALVLKDAAPLDRDFVPDSSDASNGGTDSNPHYIGVEMTYGKAATAAQRATCVRLAAAMVDMLGGPTKGYSGGSVIGHREATTTRSDPTGVPMWQFRRDVNALLTAGPAPTQEDDMPLSDTDIAKIRDAIVNAELPNHDTNPDDGQSAGTSLLRSNIVMANWRGSDLQRSVATLTAQVAALSAAVQTLAESKDADPALIADTVAQAVKDRLDRLSFDVTDAPA